MNSVQDINTSLLILYFRQEATLMSVVSALTLPGRLSQDTLKHQGMKVKECPLSLIAQVNRAPDVLFKKTRQFIGRIIACNSGKFWAYGQYSACLQLAVWNIISVVSWVLNVQKVRKISWKGNINAQGNRKRTIMPAFIIKHWVINVNKSKMEKQFRTLEKAGSQNIHLKNQLPWYSWAKMACVCTLLWIMVDLNRIFLLQPKAAKA